MTTDYQNANTNIYAWLDKIRARPGMYIHKDNLVELQLLVSGYCAALYMHTIDEKVPSIGSHFLDWIRYHKGWSMDQGWAKAIYNNLPEGVSALDTFFALIDEYRQLKPKHLAQITLDPARHSVNIGIGINKTNRTLPVQIFVVQYAPEHLYFLESVFAPEPKGQGLLVDKPEKVIELAYEEFNAEPNEWVWL
jgi:hypothetical protein